MATAAGKGQHGKVEKVHNALCCSAAAGGELDVQASQGEREGKSLCCLC